MNDKSNSQMNKRPTYTAPDNLPAALRAQVEAAAKHKWVWLSPSGVAFWLNDATTAERKQEAVGGEVFPPEESPLDQARELLRQQGGGAVSIFDCCDTCDALLTADELAAPLLFGGRYCTFCADEVRAANPGAGAGSDAEVEG
ncbi:hypothetical protein [Stenotrophomonas acidaminiphila]|uniref:hypothetical protein n=1 Tax=Stenotrophomonas acidaminiphila TaxID=128780 RepID=UPI0015F78E73|nr:hypothetical protein [Stenotrophomonas acidaminiphila]